MSNDKTAAVSVGSAIGVGMGIRPSHEAGIGALLFPTSTYTVGARTHTTEIGGMQYAVVPLLSGTNYCVGREPASGMPVGYTAIPATFNISDDGVQRMLSRTQFRVDSIEQRIGSEAKRSFALRHSIPGKLNKLALDEVIYGNGDAVRAELTAIGNEIELLDGDAIQFRPATASTLSDKFFRDGRILYRENFCDASGKPLGDRAEQKILTLDQLPDGYLALSLLRKAEESDPQFRKRLEGITLWNQQRYGRTTGTDSKPAPHLVRNPTIGAMVVDLHAVFSIPGTEWYAIGIGTSVVDTPAYVGEFEAEVNRGRQTSARSSSSTMAVGDTVETRVQTDCIIFPNSGIKPTEGRMLISRDGRILWEPRGIDMLGELTSTSYYMPNINAKDRGGPHHLPAGERNPVVSDSVIMHGTTPLDVHKRTLSIERALRLNHKPFDFTPRQVEQGPAAENAPPTTQFKLSDFLDDINPDDKKKK